MEVVGSRRSIRSSGEPPAAGQPASGVGGAERLPPLRTVQILCHAPVPVGHRVEVQFFKLAPAGPGAPSYHLLEETPIVTDLDTGIEYASMVHYDHAGRLRDWLGTPFTERLEPQPHVYFAERLTGRVVGCRVITDARTPGQTEVMTQLKIEPEPGAGRPGAGPG